MDANPYLDRPAGERSDAIVQLQAAECAIRRVLLQVISAHDQGESWKEDGAASMTGWLVAQLGVAHGTAAQLVSVAERLEELPAVASGLEEGILSWDKTRSLARFATPETESDLAEEARGLSAAQVHNLARRMRTPDDQARKRRSLRKWWDTDGEWLHIHGRIPGAEGATVEKALDRAVQRVPKNADHQVYDDHEVRLADALVEIAAGSLAADPDPDRANVVVHVDGTALTAGSGIAEVETGPALTYQTARRLCCDARLQTVLDGPDGLPIGVGRTARTIPPWLNRQIRHRDRTCRFPGCERARWVHAHHLVHWSQGGPTDLDNLVLLCPYHHRLVHEGGWLIEGSPNGDLIFIKPDGRSYQPRPQPLRTEVHKRLVESVVAGSRG
jgi:hypothetical protein